jgi:hypothetical protein
MLTAYSSRRGFAIRSGSALRAPGLTLLVGRDELAALVIDRTEREWRR